MTLIHSHTITQTLAVYMLAYTSPHTLPYIVFSSP